MKFFDQGREHTLGLFRIVLGFLFFCHGVSTLFGVLGAKGPLAFAVWPGWWAAAIQLVGGALVALGLFTRITAIICSGSMAYAYFSVHLPKALFPIQNGGEASAIFSWSFLLIAFLGSGRWAVETVLKRVPVQRLETAH